MVALVDRIGLLYSNWHHIFIRKRIWLQVTLPILIAKLLMIYLIITLRMSINKIQYIWNYCGEQIH